MCMLLCISSFPLFLMLLIYIFVFELIVEIKVLWTITTWRLKIVYIYFHGMSCKYCHFDIYLYRKIVSLKIVQLTESLDRFVHIQISLKLLLDGFKIWNQMELKFLWVSGFHYFCGMKQWWLEFLTVVNADSNLINL